MIARTRSSLPQAGHLGASGSVIVFTKMLDLVRHFWQRNSYMGITINRAYFSTADLAGKVDVLIQDWSG